MALAAVCPPTRAATATIRVVTYNIAADIDGYTTARPGLDTVIEAIGQQEVKGVVQPADVIALQETTSNAETVAPLAAVLNTYYGANLYAASPYQGTEVGNDPSVGNGPNAVLYNSRTLVLVESVGVGTPRGSSNGEYRQIVRYRFQPVGGTTAGAFYVYVSHAKSSFSGTTADVQAARAKEARILRTDSAMLPATAGVLYVGDFNLDGSAEQAYQTLTAAGPAQGVDPANYHPQDNTEDWSTAAYTALATESANSLHYRDDIQFISASVFNRQLAGGLAYIDGSYRVFGNNGTAGYRRSVNLASNTALDNLRGPLTAAATLSALTTASDHLPVVADYSVDLSPGSPAAPVITSASSAGASANESFTYQITASNNPSTFDATGLPAGLSVDPSRGLVTGTVPLAGSYTLTLSATNSGGTGTATLTLTITTAPEPAPVVTTASVSSVAGTAFTYQIAATNHPSSFAAGGLPGGLSIDVVSGIISGRTTAPGTFAVTISAANGSGTGSAVLNITVTPPPPDPPAITGATTLTTQEDEPFEYRIAATNSPTSYAAEGLPRGLRVDAASGLISGTPMDPGVFPVTLRASNAAGTSSVLLTLIVSDAPVVTPLVSFDIVGVRGSKHVTVSESGPKVKILVTRSGGDLSRALVVLYKVAGSALPGQDYKALSGVVTIPAGAASIRFKVRTHDDGVADGTKTLKLKLRPAPNETYVLGDVRKVKITILDVEAG